MHEMEPSTPQAELDGAVAAAPQAGADQAARTPASKRALRLFERAAVRQMQDAQRARYAVEDAADQAEAERMRRERNEVADEHRMREWKLAVARELASAERREAYNEAREDAALRKREAKAAQREALAAWKPLEAARRAAWREEALADDDAALAAGKAAADAKLEAHLARHAAWDAARERELAAKRAWQAVRSPKAAAAAGLDEEGRLAVRDAWLVARIEADAERRKAQVADRAVWRREHPAELAAEERARAERNARDDAREAASRDLNLEREMMLSDLRQPWIDAVERRDRALAQARTADRPARREALAHEEAVAAEHRAARLAQEDEHVAEAARMARERAFARAQERDAAQEAAQEAFQRVSCKLHSL